MGVIADDYKSVVVFGPIISKQLFSLSIRLNLEADYSDVIARSS